MKYEIHNADCLIQLDKIEENTIDSIVTDPPYELNFMGKGWDNAGISFNKETWQKCLRVLKPGGYLLAFGGSRTHHRIASAIEDAGFEIRDTIMWLYGSGFPKSMNIGLAIDKKNGVESEVVGYQKGTMPDFRDVGKKQKDISGVDKLTFGQIENSERKQQPIYKVNNKWKGWGTCLKPSYEPIIIARKPLAGTCVDNVIKWGVGGINIDECRIETKGELIDNHKTKGIPFMRNKEDYEEFERTKNEQGRFPANTILTYDETDFDEVCGGFPNTKKNGSISKVYEKSGQQVFSDYPPTQKWEAYNDSGSASRYFYCAKASKKDRDEGLSDFKQEKVNDGRKTPIDNPFQRGETPRKNTHPTVKPTELMQYLVRLVTPKGGIILDPFMGSGSTGKAVAYENKERQANYSFVGIEMEKEYCDIAKARIEYANGKD